MKRKEIMNILHNQEKIFEKNIHSIIAKELGGEKLYSQSNLWCEITDIDFRFKDLQIKITASTFEYIIQSSGHEMIEYKFYKSCNNAPNYNPFKISYIESNTIDSRALIEITNNVLRAIVKCRKQILAEMDSLLNYEYNLKEI